MIKQNTWKEIKALKTQLEVTILLIRARRTPKSNPIQQPLTFGKTVIFSSSHGLKEQPKVSHNAGGSSAIHTAQVFPTTPKKGGLEDMKLQILTLDTGSHRPAAVQGWL